MDTSIDDAHRVTNPRRSQRIERRRLWVFAVGCCVGVMILGGSPARATLPTEPAATTPDETVQVDGGDDGRMVAVAAVSLVAVGGFAGLLVLARRRRLRRRVDSYAGPPPRVGSDRRESWYVQARRAAQQARLLVEEAEGWSVATERDQVRLGAYLDKRIDLLTAQLVDVSATVPATGTDQLLRTVALRSQLVAESVKLARRTDIPDEHARIDAGELVANLGALDDALHELEVDLGLT